jgi:ribosomal protein S15P/S13E
LEFVGARGRSINLLLRRDHPEEVEERKTRSDFDLLPMSQPISPNSPFAAENAHFVTHILPILKSQLKVMIDRINQVAEGAVVSIKNCRAMAVENMAEWPDKEGLGPAQKQKLQDRTRALRIHLARHTASTSRAIAILIEAVKRLQKLIAWVEFCVATGKPVHLSFSRVAAAETKVINDMVVQDAAEAMLPAVQVAYSEHYYFPLG